MEILDKFRNWKDIEEHPAGTIIFSEGEPAEVLYVIISGKVELNLHGERLELVGEGELIGEIALSPPDTRYATAKSLTSVKLARMDRDQLNHFMGENTEFPLHVMTVLANRLRAITRRLGSV